MNERDKYYFLPNFFSVNRPEKLYPLGNYNRIDYKYDRNLEKKVANFSPKRIIVSKLESK
jgi:hypothetical protein